MISTSRMRSISVVAPILASAVLAPLPSPARAQQIDAGTVVVTFPHPPRAAITLISDPEIPDPAATELPETARAAFTRWQASVRERRRAAEQLAAAGDPARRALVERVRDLDARVDADRAALRASLERAEASLSPAALLVLGRVRHDDAQLALLRALERCDAAGGCATEPTLEAGPVLAALERAGTEGTTGAHAAYLRGAILARASRFAEARDVLRALVARPALPAPLEASALLALGDALDALGEPGAADAWARAGRSGVPVIAPVAAFRAEVALWIAGRGADALASAAPILDDPQLGAEARAIAAQVVAGLGAEGARAVAALPADARAPVLRAAARELVDDGAMTWARADLDAAAALTQDEGVRAQIAELRARADAFVDTPQLWLRRVALSCLRPTAPLETGELAVIARTRARGRRISIVGPAGSLPSFAACVTGRDVPPPEAPLRGTIRARVRVVSE